MTTQTREIRKQVLRETISAFSQTNNYAELAHNNLARWHSLAPSHHDTAIIVTSNDWGEATLKFTKQYGHIFAVLNMANATYPGGGYQCGDAAQEENMFRRSNCFTTIQNFLTIYPQHMTDTLSAKHNTVYLDINHPRICIRGNEDLSKQDLGYRWLQSNEIFPFLELRASAVDCRYHSFDAAEANKRIEAQFLTLIQHNIQHVILGAFGCGAFYNPPSLVAQIYNNNIAKYHQYFKAIIFAIYYAGYGPDNYTTFKNTIRCNY